MTTKKLLAWDIEIAKMPQSEDWKSERPLGITCAATYAQTTSNIGPMTHAPIRLKVQGGIRYDDKMSVEEACAMVHFLQARKELGFHILTWNGLGFDFDILAEESGLLAECRALALNHYDPMFQFFCYKGFPVGLDAVSRGMGLSGKTEGMSGAKAPEMWAEGRYQEVLDYVAQDVKATLEVAQAIEKHGFVRWIARSGKPNYCPFPNGLLTVKECLELPLPDNSWMDTPMDREHFTSWMQVERTAR